MFDTGSDDSKVRRLLRAAMPVTLPPNLSSSLALRRLSPLLLLTAALVALAVFFVHDSRPAAADHDTSVKEIWSATLNQTQLGSNGRGCDYTHQSTTSRCNHATRLTNDGFSYLGAPYVVNKFILSPSGTLTFQLNATPSAKFLSALTLSIGGTQFPVADATSSATVISGDTLTWTGTGLSWSPGQTVELKLTRPTFTGVELFGGDLDTSDPDGAPTLTVAEGGSATFMVKLSEQPDANVTVSIGKGAVSCAGCGGNWHDDVNAGTVSPTTLTFTTSNWNAGQTVTVTGVADDDSVHEHFLALVYVSSTTSTSPGDLFRSPEASLGVYVTVTDGSDDGSQHGGL